MQTMYLAGYESFPENRKTPECFHIRELVREAGLEPARPEWTLEPESSESANSTTRAALYFVAVP